NRFSPMLPPVHLELGLDARVMVFAFALSAVTALLFGLAPAWQATRTDLVTSLKERGAADVEARRPFAMRNALIVAQVAVSLGLGQMNLDTTLDGYIPAPNEHVAPQMNLVGPRFFETLRVPVVTGRSFSTDDAVAGEVVINEAMAMRYWPGQDPVGRRLQNLF